MMKLLPPTSYQGGKARIADKIAQILISEGKATYYDLCCGSGAVSVALVNAGVTPSQITMVDQGPWGQVWSLVGQSKFDLAKFQAYIDAIPDDTKDIQAHIKSLSAQTVNADYPYVFLLLQASSFGGKPIWIEGSSWKNCSFRSYWLPTATSNRRSPVNPMMPMPGTLMSRMKHLCKTMVGCNGVQGNIETLKVTNPSTIYIDPPYADRTKYGYDFDVMRLVNNLSMKCFLSEGTQLSPNSILLATSKERKKGGIYGNKKRVSNEEWLNIF